MEGNNILLVPSTCKKVSRRHATLLWNNGAVTLEDNESANGTFVNGKRIAKTKVTENDTIWLGGNGGEDCYQLDMKKIIDSCREAENKFRTDYSKEFQDLKQVYIDYQAEVAALKKKTTMKTQLPLRIISFIPTLIGAIIAVLPNANPNSRILAISVGGAITGLINILMIGKNGGATDQMNEEITEIQIKYQKLYRCPKCGKEYSLNTHWKKLEAEGKCTNPKCDAQFVKPADGSPSND